MKSGLEDRNNQSIRVRSRRTSVGLNEVRPGRPEQLSDGERVEVTDWGVSMKSGLEDRNNVQLTGLSVFPTNTSQ